MSVALETLQLYSQLDSIHAIGSTVADAERQEAFLTQIKKGLDESLARTARLHGWRVQFLFEAVVSAMARVALIKNEDAGGYAYDDAKGKISLPDFRIVTAEGEQLLVEVKSVPPESVWRSQPLREKDVEAQMRYAALTRSRLMVAHYWSRANLWSLVDAASLSFVAGKASLNLVDAMKRSEMPSSVIR